MSGTQICGCSHARSGFRTWLRRWRCNRHCRSAGSHTREAAVLSAAGVVTLGRSESLPERRANSERPPRSRELEATRPPPLRRPRATPRRPPLLLAPLSTPRAKPSAAPGPSAALPRRSSGKSRASWIKHRESLLADRAGGALRGGSRPAAPNDPAAIGRLRAGAFDTAPHRRHADGTGNCQG